MPEEITPMPEANSMTEERLAEIEGRVAAATEGPWFPVSYTEDRGDFNPAQLHFCVSPHEDDTCDALLWASDDYPEEQRDAIVAMVAHARTDVPDLLREVHRQADEITKLWGKVDELESTLEDEEAAHQETLQLWKQAKQDLASRTLTEAEMNAVRKVVDRYKGDYMRDLIWMNDGDLAELDAALSILTKHTAREGVS